MREPTGLNEFGLINALGELQRPGLIMTRPKADSTIFQLECDRNGDDRKLGLAEAMSGLVMGLILKHSRSRGTSRLVAVAIGDCCEDDGTGAWPAMRTIAARASTSERTAQRSITELVRFGELAIDENAGPKRANLYTIRIGRLLANGADDKLAAEKLALESKRQGAKSAPVPKLHPVREGAGGCHDERMEGDKLQPRVTRQCHPIRPLDPSVRIRP